MAGDNNEDPTPIILDPTPALAPNDPQQPAPQQAAPEQEPQLTAEQQLGMLIQQMADNLTILSQARASGGVKMNKPTIFTGRQEDVEMFLTQCDLYTSALPGKSEVEYIRALLSFVGGAASAWMQLKVTEVANGTLFWYNDVKKQLRTAFGDPDRKATAQWQLRRLCQGGMTADAYIVAFEEHQYLTGFNDEALVHIFREGLNETLWVKILSSAMISVSEDDDVITPPIERLSWWKEMA